MLFCQTVVVEGLKTEKTERKNILTYEIGSDILTAIYEPALVGGGADVGGVGGGEIRRLDEHDQSSELVFLRNSVSMAEAETCLV